MRRLIQATMIAALIAGPVAADEFEDVMDSALSAYADGEISIAVEELEYALTLLREMESDGLAAFLPEPLEGWTREEGETEGSAMAMAMFGGGTAAAATYSDGTDEFTITLVTDSPMVASIGSMVGGLASLGGGQSVRVQRTQFVDSDGELQGVIDSRVLVTVSGDGPVEPKVAHLEAMDFRALRDF